MAPKKVPDLHEKIENMREKLIHSVEASPGSLLTSEAYAISKELDKLIAESMKEKSK